MASVTASPIRFALRDACRRAGRLGGVNTESSAMSIVGVELVVECCAVWRMAVNEPDAEALEP